MAWLKPRPDTNLLTIESYRIKISSRLARRRSPVVLTRARNHLHSVLKSTVERIGESNGKIRSQKIDIKLQIPVRIEPVNRQRTAAAVG